MITTIYQNKYNLYYGLSSDTKPAGPNASRFYEMDTGSEYIYDQANTVWDIVPAPGEYRVETLTAWGQEIMLGSVSPVITLPVPTGTKVENITYIFIAASANASFTAPANWVICKEEGTAGLSTGNTISFTNLTVGSIYEISFKVITSTVIRMVMLETKTA